jgi:ribosome biogenesis GTPase
LKLAEIGWDSFFSAGFEPYRDEGLVPGRVATQHRGGYVLLTEAGELQAEVTGRLAANAAPGGLPAVGDWVAARPRPGEPKATIQAVLPRRTKFSRKTAGLRTEEQVVAANVDTVFLVAGLGRDLNLRRLERYLATAWESGAEPAVVLTKTDLYPEDVLSAVLDVEGIASGVPVHAVSGLTGEGLDSLRPHVSTGRTVALLGSSGVGKSTLVNRLCGSDMLEVGDLRPDGRGRHTTRRRELVSVPGGGLLLDTPGMRELQLWQASSGLGESFGEISALAVKCRFGDCAHDTEPGCAIRAALADGSLDAERYESYRKLERELGALEIRQDKAPTAAERRRKWRFERSRRTARY